MNKINSFSTLFLVLGITLAFGFTALSDDAVKSNLNAGANPTQQKNNATDKKVLLGNWVRTDSDYKIKISEVAMDGKLKAGYFNPKSINVSIATWTNV